MRAPRPGEQEAGSPPSGPAPDASKFYELLEAFTALHFENGDPANVNLHEYYNGETGEPYGVPDYFHSTYNDLLIRYVAGVQPSFDETVRLRPIPVPWEHFSFSGIRYRGRTLGVTWDAPGAKSGSRTGFRLFVAEREVARRPDLGPLDWPPNGGR